MLFSLSKSFTSSAVGLAVEDGRLSLDDTVVSFFPDKASAQLSANLAKMRVRDLLRMGTGNANDTFTPMKEGAEADWIKVFFAQPVEHEPGTFFRYNTGATYMLSAIVQMATGQKVVDYLAPRLFAPLGIQSPAWETSPQGITTGGYGLKVKTRDIAALGQLYLQKGQWDGKRLLSEKWVEAATSKQISNGDNPNSDWSQGYGFQFWRCRHNAFRGDGAFGQYCLVMPEQDAVLAINSGLGDMQQVLNQVWTNLLPGIKSAALPADAALRDSLAWAKNNVDYVLHTGDLIDWQSEATFDLVKKFFGDAAGTLFGSVGNHEYSPDMWLSEVKERREEAFKDLTRDKMKAAFPFDVAFDSKVVSGVNFVTLDDVYGYVTPEQVVKFRAEVAKGLPIVLCMHVPFLTDGIWLTSEKFWRNAGKKFTSAAEPPARGDRKVQLEDPATRDFIAYLKTEPLLKAILAGHLHITVQERFSPTAMQYVVGGNFMFHGQEVLFS